MKVGVNGFGTIGKRVAEAISKHSKLNLVGVTKYTPDQDARMAVAHNFDVFVPKDSAKSFEDKGVNVAGTVDDLIAESEIVVDASKDKVGAQNKDIIYSPRNKKAVFQGGEKSNVAQVSFNARSNFEKATGKQFVRVVSCNTTGYSRFIKPLTENYDIKHINAILIRRGADPNDEKGSALNSVEWQAHSHHADDIKTIIDVPITSIAFKVPHTHSHINSMAITFADGTPTKDELIDLFAKEGRIAVLMNASTSSQIVEAARDLELPRNDTFVVSLLANTIEINDNNAFLSFSVPQESIVVPENVDAIIAQAGLMDKHESMKYTDGILGIDEIKSNLEKIFA